MHAYDQQRRAAETLADPRWARIVSRDPAAGDDFCYSVKTTGVYCRPRCAARLPRPENVRFHATPTDAEQAGFRPCKRCKPDQARGDAKPEENARAGDAIRFGIGECALGTMLVASSADGICAILMDDNREALVRDAQRRFPGERLLRDDHGLERELAQVAALVQAPSHDLTLPLDVRGSDFQQRVWRTLQDIPAGTTASYGEIARRIGSPDAVRAVAGACAANPLAVAIPCHRVVRSDGGLSGYRWGIARKRALLEREARA